MGHSKHWSAPVTAGAAMLALALSVALESAPATADTVHGQAGRVEAENVDAFYDTTDLGVPAGVLTGSVPGQVFRTQAALYTPQLAGLDAGPLAAVPATATKILYASTDQWGVPVPVSGYVVEPRVPWTGPGPRPTVVVGRGTVGQGGPVRTVA